MTMIVPQKVTCALCGRESTHPILLSTNTFGEPDLDFRDPPMARDTIDWWLQECPGCGVVHHNLARAEALDPKIVSSSAYREAGMQPGFPKLARRFVRHALLVCGTDTLAAGKNYLHAAWVCDDARRKEFARELRGRSADLWLSIDRFGKEEDWLVHRLTLVDVLRRAGRPAEALDVLDTLAPWIEDERFPLLKHLATFQRVLVESGDTRCYTVDESRPRRPEGPGLFARISGWFRGESGKW